jgi:hypothetical protein
MQSIPDLFNGCMARSGSEKPERFVVCPVSICEFFVIWFARFRNDWKNRLFCVRMYDNFKFVKKTSKGEIVWEWQ